jgi:hypothetical protein
MPRLQALQWHQHKGKKRIDSRSWLSGKISRKGNPMIKDIIGAILGTLAFIGIWILAACL